MLPQEYMVLATGQVVKLPRRKRMITFTMLVFCFDAAIAAIPGLIQQTLTRKVTHE